jgi:hypothetical protein
MIMAELEVYHSRPVAPTRRVALGHLALPVDPPPGFGGVLLGGIVARYVGDIEPDLVPDLHRLTIQLENGLRIPQPRLRHRFQHDRVGLQRSTHRLRGEGDVLTFDFGDDHGAPAQQLLAAVYAAGQLPERVRPAVMGALRRAIAWQGEVGPELIAMLAGFASGMSWSPKALSHPVEWALDVLGFNGPGDPVTTSVATGSVSAPAHGRPLDAAVAAGAPNGHRNGTAGPRISREGIGPTPREIQRSYRKRLIEAHPDHGGASDDAARRIADLTEARRILLGG